MRRIVLTVCVAAAGCSGQNLTSPTSPASATVGPAHSQAQSGTALPFRGSFTFATSGDVNCPPICPPTVLRITGQAEGTASELGRFTAAFVDIVNIATTESTGTFDFTAADGAQLFARTTGRQDQFIPPDTSHVTTVGEIVGGTGRFAGATGTFTARSVFRIDGATSTATGTATFEGALNLNR